MFWCCRGTQWAASSQASRNPGQWGEPKPLCAQRPGSGPQATCGWGPSPLPATLTCADSRDCTGTDWDSANHHRVRTSPEHRVEHCISGRCWGSGYAKKESQHEEATKSKRAPGTGTFLFDSEKPHQKTVHPGGRVEISFSCLALVSAWCTTVQWQCRSGVLGGPTRGWGWECCVFWGCCQYCAGEKMAFFLQDWLFASNIKMCTNICLGDIPFITMH